MLLKFAMNSYYVYMLYIKYSLNFVVLNQNDYRQVQILTLKQVEQLRCILQQI